MRNYLDEFDASSEPEPHRSILAGQVVPALLSALSAEGLDIVVSRDLESKAAYNDLYRDDPKLTRISVIDPRFQPHATAENTLCCYLQHHGEPVGSIVSRHLWVESSFGAELERLSLLYERPEMAGDDFALCEPEAAWQRLRSVYIAWQLGGHVRSDFRRGIAYDAMARLARILILTSWKWTYALCLMEREAAGKLGFRRHGYQMASPNVYLGHGDEMHAYDLYWSERSYFRQVFARPETADLSRGVGDLPLAFLRRGSLRAAE